MFYLNGVAVEGAAAVDAGEAARSAAAKVADELRLLDAVTAIIAVKPHHYRGLNTRIAAKRNDSTRKYVGGAYSKRPGSSVHVGQKCK